MGDLTKNISQKELNCKCSDQSCNVTILPNEPIIKIVQDACDHFAEKYSVEKVKLIIASAARCYVYNRSESIGSNDNSRHPRGEAIDFKMFLTDGSQVSTKEIYDYLDNKHPNDLGLGLYNSFNHADSRPNKSRWSK